MCDRLTQLQDLVNQQAENLCNALGVIQQNAPPMRFTGFERSTTPVDEKPASQDDYVTFFAQLITKTAKDIDTVIESLPNEEATPELQLQTVQKCNADAERAARELQAAYGRGEALLNSIRAAQTEIAAVQLDAQRCEAALLAHTTIRKSS